MTKDFSERLRRRLVEAAAPAHASIAVIALAACSSPQTTTSDPKPTATTVETIAIPDVSAIPSADHVLTTGTAVPSATPVASGSSSTTLEKLSRPGWRHGAAYCIAEVDTHKAGVDKSDRSPENCDLDWADPKLRTMSDQPNGMYGFDFDAKATKEERANVKDACCYAVIRPERGRPLRGDDDRREAIVAGAANRSDWLTRVACDASTLSAEDRARLADVWARDAALEHASIAEFSRVTLSLMALGAPPELLQRTHEAALDEVRHAEVSFGIASALAGRSIGPGPLPLDASKPSHVAPGERPRVTFAKATLRDGCVGETIASLEAAEASEGATGELRSLLRAIADDEARHATLAFSTVAWLLSTASAEERADIEAFVNSLLHDIDAELAGPATAPIEAPTDAIDAAWGRVSARDLARLRREGLRGVVRPAVEALLVSPSDRGVGAPRA